MRNEKDASDNIAEKSGEKKAGKAVAPFDRTGERGIEHFHRSGEKKSDTIAEPGRGYSVCRYSAPEAL